MKTIPGILLAVLAASQIVACSRDDKPAPTKPPPPKVAVAAQASAAPVAPASAVPSANVDRARIVPVIWMKGAARSDFLVDPLNDELVVLYAEDNGKEMRMLMAKDLEPAAIKRDELRALAVANLRSVVPQVRLHQGNEYSMFTAGGTYESSLLLTPQVLTASNVKVEGDIVLAVPARNLLFVTGTRTPGGVAKLREVAGRAMRESPNRLTDTLFVLRGGEIVKFGE
ncbi:MAG TPA: DUF1444 family protein [Usitatibacter sp.]|jgi:uncharacterized protein YtpQ (UPF0354 family)|nr:DUF1444 family protein [Usitatibacter sp.]